MDIKLDLDTWDYDLDASGDLQFVTGIDEVVQGVGQTLKLWLGEWALDQSAGVPYVDLVFERPVNARAIDAMFKDKVLSYPGMLSLDSWDLQIDAGARQLQLDFTGKCTSGPIDFSQTLIMPAPPSEGTNG